jgi:hypothetical protein
MLPVNGAPKETTRALADDLININAYSHDNFYIYKSREVDKPDTVPAVKICGPNFLRRTTSEFSKIPKNGPQS